METLKQILKSRTIRKAVAKGLSAVLIIALTELDMVGYIVMVETAYDIYLRMDTTKPVNEL